MNRGRTVSSISGNFDPEDEKISGWVICRLNVDVSELSSMEGSILKYIYDLFYGSLWKGESPPTNGWVFLGRDPSIRCVVQEIEPELRELCYQSTIQTIPISIENEGYHLADLTTLPQPDVDTPCVRTGETIEAIYVQGSPYSLLNGTYLYKGEVGGGPIYQHVRGWVVMRCWLPTITVPSDSLTLLDNGEITNNESQVDNMDQYTFNELAKAGLRFVRVDKAMARSDLENKRSKLRLEAGQALLERLAMLATKMTNVVPTDSRLDHNETTLLTSLILSSNITYQSAQFSGQAAFSKNPQLSTALPNNTLVVPSKNPTYLHPDWTCPLSEAESELAQEVLSSIVEREAAVASLSTVLQQAQKSFFRYQKVKKSQISTKKSYGSFNHSLSTFISIDGETTPKIWMDRIITEVNFVRAKTINFLESYTAWSRLFHQLYHQHQQKLKKFVPVLNPQEKKELIKQQEENALIHSDRPFCVVVGYYHPSPLYKTNNMLSITKKEHEDDAVKPKKSSDSTTSARKIELKYIGCYPTEKEAVFAYEKAMQAIPLPQWGSKEREHFHLKGSLGHCVRLTVRPCLKHHLISGSLVSKNLHCEQCTDGTDHITDFNSKKVPLPSTTIVNLKTSLTKIDTTFENLVLPGEKKRDNTINKDIMPPFLWKDENYIEKIWRDVISLIAPYRIMLLEWVPSLALVNGINTAELENIEENDQSIALLPLLLDESIDEYSLHQLSQYHIQVKNIGAYNMDNHINKSIKTLNDVRPTFDSMVQRDKHLFNSLKGKREQLEDAISYGKKIKQQQLKKEKQEKFNNNIKNSPYGRDQCHDLPILRDTSEFNLLLQKKKKIIEKKIQKMIQYYKTAENDSNNNNLLDHTMAFRSSSADANKFQTVDGPNRPMSSSFSSTSPSLFAQTYNDTMDNESNFESYKSTEQTLDTGMNHWETLYNEGFIGGINLDRVLRAISILKRTRGFQEKVESRRKIRLNEDIKKKEHKVEDEEKNKTTKKATNNIDLGTTSSKEKIGLKISTLNEFTNPLDSEFLKSNVDTAIVSDRVEEIQPSEETTIVELDKTLRSSKASESTSESKIKRSYSTFTTPELLKYSFPQTSEEVVYFAIEHQYKKKIRSSPDLEEVIALIQLQHQESTHTHDDHKRHQVLMNMVYKQIDKSLDHKSKVSLDENYEMKKTVMTQQDDRGLLLYSFQEREIQNTFNNLGELPSSTLKTLTNSHPNPLLQASQSKYSQKLDFHFSLHAQGKKREFERNYLQYILTKFINPKSSSVFLYQYFCLQHFKHIVEVAKINSKYVSTLKKTLSADDANTKKGKSGDGGIIHSLIDQAENIFAKIHQASTESIPKIQAWLRGCVSRDKTKKIWLEKRRKFFEKESSIYFSKDIAASFVSNVISTTVKNLSKRRISGKLERNVQLDDKKKSLFFTHAINFNNSLNIIKIFQSRRFFRANVLSICNYCNIDLRKSWIEEKKKSADPPVRNAKTSAKNAKLNQFKSFIFNPLIYANSSMKTLLSSNNHQPLHSAVTPPCPICVCPMELSEEQWVIKIYNPFTSASFMHHISSKEALEILKQIETSKHKNFNRVLAKQASSMGKYNYSKGDIRTLYPPESYAHPSNYPSVNSFYSFFNSWRTSTKENISFTKIPTKIPPTISSLFNSKFFTIPENWRFHLTDNSKIVNDSKIWEPFSIIEKLYTKVENIKIAIVNISAHCTDISKRERDLRSKYKFDKHRFELNSMRIEDILSNLQRLEDKIYQYEISSSNQFDLLKKINNMTKLQEMEMLEDDMRSYDPHVPGYRNETLNLKYKLKKKYNEQKDILFQSLKILNSQNTVNSEFDQFCKQIENEKIQADLNLRRMKDELIVTEARLEDLKGNFKYFLQIFLNGHTFMKTFKKSFSKFNTNEKFSLSNPVFKPNLQDKFLVRDPKQRLNLENRNELLLPVHKVVKKIQVNKKYSKASSDPSKHFSNAIYLYKDPLTNNMLIKYASIKNVETEEGSQHVDFNLPPNTFNSFNDVIESTDVVLQPSDIKLILSRANNDQESEEVSRSLIRQKSKSYVILSERPRPLDGVKIIEKKEKSLNKYKEFLKSVNKSSEHGIKTYYSNMVENEKSELEIAEIIFNSIDLHPLSFRPAVSSLAFNRRIKALENLIFPKDISVFHSKSKSFPLWSNELMTSNPSILKNLFFKRVMNLNNYRVDVEGYHHLDKFLVITKFVRQNFHENSVVMTNINFQSLIKSLSIDFNSSIFFDTVINNQRIKKSKLPKIQVKTYSPPTKPLLLISHYLRTITEKHYDNHFLIDHILNHLTMTPTVSGLRPRDLMFNETPGIIFDPFLVNNIQNLKFSENPEQASSLASPQYAFHRFVTAKYVKISVYTTSSVNPNFSSNTFFSMNSKFPQPSIPISSSSFLKSELILVFSTPTISQFSHHHHKGEDVRVVLSYSYLFSYMAILQQEKNTIRRDKLLVSMQKAQKNSSKESKYSSLVSEDDLEEGSNADLNSLTDASLTSNIDIANQLNIYNDYNFGVELFQMFHPYNFLKLVNFILDSFSYIDGLSDPTNYPDEFKETIKAKLKRERENAPRPPDIEITTTSSIKPYSEHEKKSSKRKISSVTFSPYCLSKSNVSEESDSPLSLWTNSPYNPFSFPYSLIRLPSIIDNESPLELQVDLHSLAEGVAGSISKFNFWSENRFGSNSLGNNNDNSLFNNIPFFDASPNSNLTVNLSRNLGVNDDMFQNIVDQVEKYNEPPKWIFSPNNQTQDSQAENQNHYISVYSGVWGFSNSLSSLPFTYIDENQAEYLKNIYIDDEHFVHLLSTMEVEKYAEKLSVSHEKKFSKNLNMIDVSLHSSHNKQLLKINLSKKLKSPEAKLPLCDEYQVLTDEIKETENIFLEGERSAMNVEDKMSRFLQRITRNFNANSNKASSLLSQSSINLYKQNEKVWELRRSKYLDPRIYFETTKAIKNYIDHTFKYMAEVRGINLIDSLISTYCSNPVVENRDYLSKNLPIRSLSLLEPSKRFIESHDYNSSHIITNKSKTIENYYKQFQKPEVKAEVVVENIFPTKRLTMLQQKQANILHPIFNSNLSPSTLPVSLSLPYATSYSTHIESYLTHACTHYLGNKHFILYSYFSERNSKIPLKVYNTRDTSSTTFRDPNVWSRVNMLAPQADKRSNSVLLIKKRLTKILEFPKHQEKSLSNINQILYLESDVSSLIKNQDKTEYDFSKRESEGSLPEKAILHNISISSFGIVDLNIVDHVSGRNYHLVAAPIMSDLREFYKINYPQFYDLSNSNTANQSNSKCPHPSTFPDYNINLPYAISNSKSLNFDTLNQFVATSVASNFVSGLIINSVANVTQKLSYNQHTRHIFQQNQLRSHHQSRHAATLEIQTNTIIQGNWPSNLHNTSNNIDDVIKSTESSQSTTMESYQDIVTKTLSLSTRGKLGSNIFSVPSYTFLQKAASRSKSSIIRQSTSQSIINNLFTSEKKSKPEVNESNQGHLIFLPSDEANRARHWQGASPDSSKKFRDYLFKNKSSKEEEGDIISDETPEIDESNDYSDIVRIDLPDAFVYFRASKAIKNLRMKYNPKDPHPAFNPRLFSLLSKSYLQFKMAKSEKVLINMDDSLELYDDNINSKSGYSDSQELLDDNTVMSNISVSSVTSSNSFLKMEDFSIISKVDIEFMKNLNSYEKLTPLMLAFCGDVVIMIKNSVKLYKGLIKVLKQFSVDYLPTLMIRREKAGRENEWRAQNIIKFKLKIMVIAKLLLPYVQDIFNGKLWSRNTQGLEEYSQLSSKPASFLPALSASHNELYRLAILLLVWFDKTKTNSSSIKKNGINFIDFPYSGNLLHIDDLEEHHNLEASNGNSLQDYDYPYVIEPVDSFIFESAGISENIEEKQDFNAPIKNPYYSISLLNSSYINILQRILTPADSPENESDEVNMKIFDNYKSVYPLFNPSQLVYAMLQLHCHYCQIPLSDCNFPGCREVRSSTIIDFCLPVHSGYHPIDKSIKKFLSSSLLLSQNQYKDLMPHRYLIGTHPLFLEQQVAHQMLVDKEKDYYDHQKFILTQKLKSHWQEITLISNLFELFHTFMLPQEWRNLNIHPLIYIKTLGGQKYNKVIKQITDLMKQLNIRYQYNKKSQRVIDDLDNTSSPNRKKIVTSRSNNKSNLSTESSVSSTLYQQFIHRTIRLVEKTEDSTNIDLEDDNQSLVVSNSSSELQNFGYLPVSIIKRIINKNQISSSDPYPTEESGKMTGANPMPNELYNYIMSRLSIVSVSPYLTYYNLLPPPIPLGHSIPIHSLNQRKIIDNTNMEIFDAFSTGEKVGIQYSKDSSKAFVKLKNETIPTFPILPNHLNLHYKSNDSLVRTITNIISNYYDLNNTTRYVSTENVISKKEAPLDLTLSKSSDSNQVDDVKVQPLFQSTVVFDRLIKEGVVSFSPEESVVLTILAGDLRPPMSSKFSPSIPQRNVSLNYLMDCLGIDLEEKNEMEDELVNQKIIETLNKLNVDKTDLNTNSKLFGMFKSLTNSYKDLTLDNNDEEEKKVLTESDKDEIFKSMGWTILLYDINSGVSRHIFFSRQDINRFKEIISSNIIDDSREIQTGEDFNLAEILIDHGSVFLQINRVGTYCTGFGINMIPLDSNFSKSRTNPFSSKPPSRPSSRLPSASSRSFYNRLQAEKIKGKSSSFNASKFDLKEDSLELESLTKEMEGIITVVDDDDDIDSSFDSLSEEKVPKGFDLDSDDESDDDDLYDTFLSKNFISKKPNNHQSFGSNFIKSSDISSRLNLMSII